LISFLNENINNVSNNPKEINNLFILVVAGKRLTMKIKTTLKKLKRGDVVSIDWIDAGDLSGGFQEKDVQLLVILSIVLNLIP